MSSTAQLPLRAAEAPVEESGTTSAEEGRRGLAWRIGGVVFVLLPAAITVYMAFRTGGYYAETYAGVLAIVAVGLGVAAIVSRRAFAGWSPALIVAGAALSLLVTWTWFSSEWSDAPQRALFESQRTALYLVGLLLFGSLLRRRGGLALATCGLAAAILAVCVAALATRLFPDTFTISEALSPARLSFPLSYWNSLGLFAAIGVVLLLHLSADLRTRAAVRVIAAACVPATAATIYLTFSRGATGAVALGVVAYAIIGRPRGLVSAAAAGAPATAFALQAAYDADLLGTETATSAAAAAQGHDVAVALVIASVAAAAIRLALVPLDRRVMRIPPLTQRARRGLLVGAALAAFIAGAAFVAADGPSRVQDAYESFTKPENGGDARSRFRQVTLSGRQDHWNVALEYFRGEPLTGVGAGTYETQWLRSRQSDGVTDQAHSLYVEMLSELGIVGLLLISTALVALLAGLLRRARGDRRAAYAAVFAALMIWAVHAGVDWDWELPAVGFGLFALTGIALAEPTPAARRFTRTAASWPFRAGVALACLLISTTAVRTVIADAALDEAKRHFRAGDCRTTRADARTALSAVATHPKGHELLGWCDIDDGRNLSAVEEMREAARLDPTNWRYRYGLAIVRGAAGQDPRPDLRRARRLNPRAQIFSGGATARLSDAGRARWRRLSANAARPAD